MTTRIVRAVFIVTLLAIGAVTASATPTLITQNGILMGANGVIVGGNSYDVTFTPNGSCATLYNGCDSPADFPFNTQAAATQASQALLDEVFNGTFELYPNLINGCGANFSLRPAVNAYACTVHTPWASTFFYDYGDDYEVSTLYTVSALQLSEYTPNPPPYFHSEHIDEDDFTGIPNSGVDVNLSGTRETWAVWSVAPTFSTPEPSTLWTLLPGLGIALYTMRRKVGTKVV